MIKPVATVCFLLCLSFLTGEISAQSSSQFYRLHVPNTLSLDTPETSLNITHDLSESDQAFPEQRWVARNRSRNGAIVRFETTQPFTHTTKPTAQRDVQLALRKNGSPQWRINQASDQTDYKNGKTTAFVDAESNRQGRGAFRLRVTFVEEGLETLEAGDYQLVVIGTLIPK